MADRPPRQIGATSQTLSRGIRVLELLADAREPLSIDDLARALDVHRSIAYRLVRTHEEHRLVARDGAGLVSLAPRLAALAAAVEHDLQAAALPELTAIANELGMTALIAVVDHDDCVTLTSVEPRAAVASVAQRPGSRHPLTRGAPGRALLAQLDDAAWPVEAGPELTASVAEVRERGFAVSHDEVISRLRAVAVPLSPGIARPGFTVAALGVVFVAAEQSDEELARVLERGARAVRETLGQVPGGMMGA